ncbi:hypothetical protein AZZ60_001547, partial [Escherichia coli]
INEAKNNNNYIFNNKVITISIHQIIGYI